MGYMRRLVHVSVSLVLFGRMFGVNMGLAGNMFQAYREFVRSMLGAEASWEG